MFRGESLTIKLKPRLVSTYLTEIKPCLLILSGKKKKKTHKTCTNQNVEFFLVRLLVNSSIKRHNKPKWGKIVDYELRLKLTYLSGG